MRKSLIALSSVMMMTAAAQADMSTFAAFSRALGFSVMGAGQPAIGRQVINGKVSSDATQGCIVQLKSINDKALSIAIAVNNRVNDRQTIIEFATTDATAKISVSADDTFIVQQGADTLTLKHTIDGSATIAQIGIQKAGTTQTCALKLGK